MAAALAVVPGDRERRHRGPAAGHRTGDVPGPQRHDQFPRGFPIDPDQAVAIAKTAPKMVAIHRAHHPLQIVALRVGRQPLRDLLLLPRTRSSRTSSSAATAQIGPTYTGPLILGIYGRGHYGQIFDSPLVLVPFTLMFLLPLLLLRGRSWFDRFDIAALLTFGISYAAVRHAHLEAGVWLFYPPLLYLLVRMLIRGCQVRAPRARRLDCRLPTAVLVVGLLALVVARIDIDASPGWRHRRRRPRPALGAYKLLHGQSLYYFSLGHGDTYGPIALPRLRPVRAAVRPATGRTCRPPGRRRSRSTC